MFAVTAARFAHLWRTQANRVSPEWRRTRLLLLAHILKVIADVELNDIQPHHIWQIQSSCEQHGLAASTINKITHNVLPAFLRDAELAGHYEGDRRAVFRGVTKLPEVIVSPRGPWTREERDLILRVCSRTLGRELTSWVAWLFYTGMRPSESLALTWDDVDIPRRWCRIYRSRNGKHISPCKTKQSRREITLARPAVAVLTALSNTAGYIFLTPAGSPIDLHNFTNRQWRAVMDSLDGKVTRRHLYCTRHSFISHCLDGGMLPAAVSRQVGSSVATILRDYYRWTQPIDADEMDIALDGNRRRLASV